MSGKVDPRVRAIYYLLLPWYGSSIKDLGAFSETIRVVALIDSTDSLSVAKTILKELKEDKSNEAG